MFTWIRRVFGGSPHIIMAKSVFDAPIETLFRIPRDGPNYIRAKAIRDSRFKQFEWAKVAGISKGHHRAFLRALLANGYFRIEIERENNPYHAHALKVIGVQGSFREHLGYVPRDLAETLKDEPEIAAELESVILPDKSLRINILVLKVAEKKRLAKLKEKPPKGG